MTVHPIGRPGRLSSSDLLQLATQQGTDRTGAGTGTGNGAGALDASNRRPPLQLLCSGATLTLSDEEVDLIALVNSADEHIMSLLDLDADPDEYRLTEVLIEHLLHRYGVERRANGDRVTSIVSALRRHLLPFLIELDETRPADRRGVGHMRITHLEQLPRVLSGDLDLPAATVAGDRLKRRGVACVYLTLHDAAEVTVGGELALRHALDEGRLQPRIDLRTGEPIVMALHLRQAGLLIEPEAPHGIQRSTSGNVLRDLKLAVDRARGHGATIRGTFHLSPVEPLAGNQARAPRAGQSTVTLSQTAALAAQMSVIAQAVLWIGRLVGTRIGETFGLLVCDFFRDEYGRPWLDFSKQGGVACLERDPATGRLVPQTRKPHTKTPRGVRLVPVPRQLGDLLDTVIAAFHTDPDTGLVDYEARLVPGVGRDDESGQSTFREALETARADLGLTTTPHDLRDCLITDLRNGGIGDRVAHFYAGHERHNASIQDRHYDLGVAPELLLEVSNLLEATITAELGACDLRVPTSVRHQWGPGTRTSQRIDHVDRTLTECGWHATPSIDARGPEMTVQEIHRRLGRSGQTLTRTRSMLRDGTIRAHQRSWGTRQIWVAYEKDVEAYLQATSGISINDLADEIGWTYHQVWQELRRQQLISHTHTHGARILLTPALAAKVRAEVDRQARVIEQAVMLSEVSAILDITPVSVETLVRKGILEITAGPTSSRDRWVSRESLEEYQRTYITTREVEDVAPLTFTETRKLLGVTRPYLTALTTTRQLQTQKVLGSRHVYINTRSALAYARRAGLTDAVECLRAALDQNHDASSL